MPGERDLSEAAARVVGDDGRCLEAERLDCPGDQIGVTGRCEVGLWHRKLVRPERQIERDAAKVG